MEASVARGGEQDFTIDGEVAPGFEPVRAAFAENFRTRREQGAAFAVTLDGQPVVDLWGGVADAESARPWRRDTLQLIFSGTKGLVALCVLMLVDRGQLDPDAPVARYWPEFAAEGKGDVRVSELTSHQARLPGFRTRIAEDELVDDVRLGALLAAQPMESDPRALSCYHPLSYGWLCGELVRRVDGRSVGRFFAEEVASPLGLDVWIGLPAELEGRVSTLRYADDWGQRRVWDERCFARTSCWNASGTTRHCSRRAGSRGTSPAGIAPRSPAPAASGRPARSPVSTAVLPAAASSTACGCCRRRRLRADAGSLHTGPTRCSTSHRCSGSASSCRTSGA